MCNTAEVAVIDLFYRAPPSPEPLLATLSLCNPPAMSPFMWWLWSNSTALRVLLKNEPPLSLGHRLIDRAEAEGPKLDEIYQALRESATRARQ